MVRKKMVSLAAVVAACVVAGSVMADQPGMEGHRSQHGTTETQIRSSQLVGTTIYNRQNEELGEISEIVVASSGNAKFVVFSHGGLMGIGSKSIVVPWNALQFKEGTAEDEIKTVLDIEKQRLDQAPSFTEDNPPDFSSPEYVSKVQSFYGTKPGQQSGK